MKIKHKYFPLKKLVALSLALLILVAAACDKPPASQPGTVKVTGVFLSERVLSMEIGDSVQLTATVSPADAADKTVTWSSGNTAVAEVSQTGLVSAVGAGDAVITVKTNDGEKTATCSVTVEEEEEEVFVPRTWSKNTATPSEINAAKEYYNGIISDLRLFPVSFKIGDNRHYGFSGSAFTTEEKSDVAEEGARRTSIKLEHTESGLIFAIDSVLYTDYAAYEWVVNISNPTEENSPVISELYGLDRAFEGTSPKLYTTKGDRTQFLPEIFNLNGVKSFKPDTGRSTEGAFPYYNIEYGTGGMLLAIGWAGQWFSNFDNSADSSVMNVTAGQLNFNAYLEPGENIRTPTISIINYDNRDSDRAANLWRRWYIDNIMYRVLDENGDRVLFQPQTYTGAAPQGDDGAVTEGALSTEEALVDMLQFLIDSGIAPDVYCNDAGWYYDANGQYLGSYAGSWQKTGTWEWDAERYPTKSAAIGALAAEYGIETLLWFEPERIAIDISSLKDDGSTLKKEWIISGNYVDLSIPEAVDWYIDRIITVMREGGISLYREDYNTWNPEGYWEVKDAELGANRRGVTENKRIQGHFRLWEAILEAFPGAPIDSCASGGLSNDLDTMRYAWILHRTDYDYWDNLANQCYSLEMYKWFPYFTAPHISPYPVKYQLRMSLTPGMRYPGVTYKLAPDLDMLKEAFEEFDAIKDYYYSDYYDLLGYSRTESRWVAWEFFDESAESGFAMYFRHKNAPASETLYLKGLDPDRDYHIWFEDRGEHYFLSGQELMEDGLEVLCPVGESSDIMYISHKYMPKKLTAEISRVSLGGLYGDAVEIENGYARTDIRFNKSLRDTVFDDAGSGVETNFVDMTLMSGIKLNDETLLDLYNDDAQNVRLDYDTVNNILRVWVKTSCFSFQNDAVITLASTLATYAGAALGRDYSFKYHSSEGEWAEGSADPTAVPVLDYEIYDPPGELKSFTDLSEERISAIPAARPWEISTTGIYAWANPHFTIGGAVGLTKAAAAQYSDGKQAIVIDYAKMLTGNDYTIPFCFGNVTPGAHIKMTFMAYADTANTNDVALILEEEKNGNHDSGSIGNYLAKGSLASRTWKEFSIEFIASPGGRGIVIARIRLSKPNASTTAKVYIDDVKVTVQEYPTVALGGHDFEESMELGAMPAVKPWSVGVATVSGFRAWQYGVTENWDYETTTPFSVENGDAYDGSGKVITADFGNLGMDVISRQADAGYHLNYYFRSLESNKAYYLTFRVKGAGVKNVYLEAESERNFGSASENKYGKTVGVTGKAQKISVEEAKWTDVTVPFMATPDSSGVCCLRLRFRPTMFQRMDGKFILDNFALEESTLDSTRFGAVSAVAPWEIPDNFAGGFAMWTYPLGMINIFTWDSDSCDGDGAAILADLSDATAAASVDGHGYNLDYYARGLTEGESYSLTFMYKTDGLTDTAVVISNEPNFGHITMESKTLDINAEWTQVTLEFTAGAPVKGLHCVRIAVYPNSGKTGAGRIWVDCFELSTL